MPVSDDLKNHDLLSDPMFTALANAKLGPSADPLSDLTLAYLASMPEVVDLWTQYASAPDFRSDSRVDDAGPRGCLQRMASDPIFDLCLKRAVEATRWYAQGSNSHDNIWKRINAALNARAKRSPDRFVAASLLIGLLAGVLSHVVLRSIVQAPELARSLDNLKAATYNVSNSTASVAQRVGLLNDSVDRLYKASTDVARSSVALAKQNETAATGITSLSSSILQTNERLKIIDGSLRSVGSSEVALTAELDKLVALVRQQPPPADRSNDKLLTRISELGEHVQNIANELDTVTVALRGLNKIDDLNKTLGDVATRISNLKLPISNPEPEVGTFAITMTLSKGESRILAVPQPHAHYGEFDRPTFCAMRLSLSDVRRHEVELILGSTRKTFATSLGTISQCTLPPLGLTLALTGLGRPLPGTAATLSLETTAHKFLFFPGSPVNITVSAAHGIEDITDLNP